MATLIRSAGFWTHRAIAHDVRDSSLTRASSLPCYYTQKVTSPSRQSVDITWLLHHVMHHLGASALSFHSLTHGYWATWHQHQNLAVFAAKTRVGTLWLWSIADICHEKFPSWPWFTHGSFATWWRQAIDLSVCHRKGHTKLQQMKECRLLTSRSYRLSISLTSKFRAPALGDEWRHLFHHVTVVQLYTLLSASALKIT